MGTCRVAITILVLPFLMGAARATRQEDRPQVRDHTALSAALPSSNAVIADVTFKGLRRVAPEAVKAQITGRAGDPLDRAWIDRAVRSVARLGWFETVRVEAEDATEITEYPSDRSRRVRLVFYLEEHPFLSSVDYHGSRLLSQPQIQKLLAEKGLSPKLGEPENPVTLHHAARAIRSALADLGHPEAQVQVQFACSAAATVRVQFVITDGPYLPVGRVEFAGHPEVRSKLLRQQMRRITPHSFFSAMRRTHSYTPEAYEEDRERLLAYYQNHGFPEARISRPDLSQYQSASHRFFPWPHKSTSTRLAVIIPIEAGPFYEFGAVGLSDTVAQAVPLRRQSQMALSSVQPGKPYSAQAVENLRRAWQARIQPAPRRDQPATFRNVDAIPSFDQTSHTARMRLDISSTPPYIVRRLEFLGIHHFPDRFFRRRILLKEGAPLDEPALQAGLARLARTGYFKPLRKENIRVETNDLRHTADVTVRVQELGQQRISLVGGRGQFGSTLGIAYAVFNLLAVEELLFSHLEGGPESLQLALALAKDGFLGSRGSLAISVFNMFLQPRIVGSVKGPFFKQETVGMNVDWTYALTNVDALGVNYSLSRSRTQYSPILPAGLAGLIVSDIRTSTSSHWLGLGWTHDAGNQRMVFSNSVSGGWLGGSESLVRSKAEYSRTVHDHVFDHRNAWAFRTTFTGIGSYSGDMPFYSRLFAGDEFVRGLRYGQLGPQALISPASPSGGARYSTSAAGANLISAANSEYRMPLPGGAEAAGFFDLGSGILLPNWLGRTRPSLIDSTNGLLHGSAGLELRWTLPVVNIPLRTYCALNLLRLDRSLLLPDGSLFHARNRFSSFGWALGTLF